jgi:cytochrome c biogenesis protein CcmG/thiol:disulfide interchange protein DsbE
MTDPAIPSATPKRRWLMALPLVVFAALALLFWFRLGDSDISRIPSALIGRAAPTTTLPPLSDLTTFVGKVSLVNVWASWCVPCHSEAPLLTEFAKDRRVQFVGINYKDAPENARRFLGRYGNPFDVVGVDSHGRASIEWGVYGVPETFVVARDGTIAYKLVGEITPQNIEAVLKPEIEKALKAGS